MNKFFVYLIALLGATNALAQSSSPSSQSNGQRKLLALVVGNANYAFESSLLGVDNDALDMADALKKLGFTVVNNGKLTNLSKADFQAAIDAFINHIDSNTVALIYFSGHGLEESGENFLLPQDAYLRSPSDVPNQSIALQPLLNRLEQREALARIVILDACRNMPASLSSKGIAEGGLARTEVGSGTRLVFAAAPRRKAAPAPRGGRNSVFTAALLQAMSEPLFSFDDVLARAGQLTVASTLGNREPQQPWMTGSLGMTFRWAPVRTGPSIAGASPVQAMNIPSQSKSSDVSGAAANAGSQFWVTSDPGGPYKGVERTTGRINMEVSPSGKLIAQAFPGFAGSFHVQQFQLFNMSSGELVVDTNRPATRGVEFSSDNESLLLRANYDDCQLIDTRSGKVSWTTEASDCSFASSSKSVFYLGGAGMHLFKVAVPSYKSTFVKLKEVYKALASSRDGQFLLILAEDKKSMAALTAENFSSVTHFKSTSDCFKLNDAQFALDNNTIVSHSGRNICVWDRRSASIKQVLDVGVVSGVLKSSDSGRLFYGANESNEIFVADVGLGKVVFRRQADQVLDFRLSRDERYLAYGSSANAFVVRLDDGVTARVPGSINGVTFSRTPDTFFTQSGTFVVMVGQ